MRYVRAHTTLNDATQRSSLCATGSCGCVGFIVSFISKTHLGSVIEVQLDEVY